MRRRDEVSICIPAWQSAAFIGRTLDFALGQTHRRIRVLVSVDRSDDGTAELCLARASADRRLQVFVQHERLGWAGNVNFLLGRVRTPYFFLYFHDDVLLPQYTERLLHRLRSRPDAASVHCDMGHFGATDHVSVGLAYEGAAVQRLGAFLVAPERGSPLRSLTRTTVLARGARMPEDACAGLWANEPYLMRLLAAGPALHLPETLYYRWDQRSGGLTDGWKRLAPGQLQQGFAANIRTALGIIASVATGDGERRALNYCLQVHMRPRLHALAREHGAAATIDLGAIAPELTVAPAPGELDCLGGEIREWLARRHAWMLESMAEPRTA